MGSTDTNHLRAQRIQSEVEFDGVFVDLDLRGPGLKLTDGSLPVSRASLHVLQGCMNCNGGWVLLLATHGTACRERNATSVLQQLSLGPSRDWKATKTVTKRLLTWPTKALQEQEGKGPAFRTGKLDLSDATRDAGGFLLLPLNNPAASRSKMKRANTWAQRKKPNKHYRMNHSLQIHSRKVLESLVRI